MKKKQSKKLHLSKLTVASLNAAEQSKLNGGKILPPTTRITQLSRCYICDTLDTL